MKIRDAAVAVAHLQAQLETVPNPSIVPDLEEEGDFTDTGQGDWESPEQDRLYESHIQNILGKYKRGDLTKEQTQEVVD